MMVRKIVLCGMLLAGVSICVVAADKHDHAAPAPQSNAAFDKLRSLVGTWVMADKDGKPTDDVVTVIKLTAAGNTIQETIFPGQSHEMVSMYTVEGSDVLLTHYCMLGNQPRMKASSKSIVDNKLNFEFAGGSNLDPKKDKHMHAAVIKFIDADHYEMEGIGWENGAPAKEMCAGMKLVRKK